MSDSTKVAKRYLRHGDSPASQINVANIITVFRILLAPLFVAFLVLDDGELGLFRYLAAALFILGMATDSLDGNLARKRNLVTNLGKLIDPIADKVLIGAALVTLSILDELPWWVTVVILTREIGITLFRFLVLRRMVIAANSGGKLKTVFQTIAISFYLVPLWVWLGSWVHWLNASLMTVAFILTVYSGAQYLVAAYKSFKSSTTA